MLFGFLAMYYPLASTTLQLCAMQFALGLAEGFACGQVPPNGVMACVGLLADLATKFPEVFFDFILFFFYILPSLPLSSPLSSFHSTCSLLSSLLFF